MSLLADLGVIRQMIFPPGRGATHRERLESFYRGQAERYDDFRRRLLHGRGPLFDALEPPEGGVWIDLGAGTGSNAELLGARLGRLKRAVLVDLCGPLLEVACGRVREHRWTNVEVVQADATSFRLDEPADLVTFSYSLTMMPDWFEAVERAREALRPGGRIGVTDFYVSRKHPEAGLRRHGGLARALFPITYGWDGVYVSPDHLPYLRRRFETERLEEKAGRIPYVPFLRSPYYVFVGRKA
jgi:S-adenosylmethionine-diacylgycerolhomoserine-N-methlytransferase